MNHLCSAPAWNVFRKKLKAQYLHLMDADLAAVEPDQTEIFQQLQRVAGCSCIELARLADEVTEASRPGLNCLWLRFAQSEERQSRQRLRLPPSGIE